MRKSLGLRLVVLVVLVIGISYAVLGLYLSSTLKQDAQSSQENELLQSAQKVAEQLGPDFRNADQKEAVNKSIQSMAQVTGYRITIVSTDGTVLFDSEEDPQAMENHITRPEIAHALSGSPSIELRYSRTLQQQLMYAAVPVKSGLEILAVARTAYPVDLIENEMAVLNRTMLNALLAAALVTILLTAFFAFEVIKPLRRLTSQIDRYETGAPPETGLKSRRDEIGQLEKAFERMAGMIDNRFTELNTERMQLDAILNHMNDGILIINAEGNVERINLAALSMFNLTSQDAINRSAVEVLRQVQLIELWKACSATGKQQVTTVETSPGRLFLQGIATPVTWGEKSSIMLIFQDLTRIHQLELVRKEFVSNVSHELRTPLSSMRALNETLQDTISEEPEVSQNFLKKMDQELDNLIQLVNELLELSRLESGRVPIDRQRVSPSVLLQSAEDHMKLQAERNGLEIMTIHNNVLPDVSADFTRIDQVFTNLIHNAIKFTPPGGKITLSAMQEEDQVVFTIEDTGIGISPEVLPRIFERFYKADRSRASTGTGLGLSISKHVIESHGGKIWAESVEGKGSKFSFSLPIIQA
ncbi:MAG TPA: ATP-binding protein [Anaerolineaceae bacterium]|nr:ATP-binding protein [Anaerolineaceae bacterium]